MARQEGHGVGDWLADLREHPRQGRALIAERQYLFHPFRVSWARANRVSYFLFEALDENWKAAQEGPQGACWGLWDKNGLLKCGMRPVFNSRLPPESCPPPNPEPIGGPGTAEIRFSAPVPPFGSNDNLRGQVRHVIAADYKVAVFIRVGAGWWMKPTQAQPLTPIRPDGTWECDITTGGNDPQANRIAAYLVPAGYTPPTVLGAANLPGELDQNAVAKVEVNRALPPDPTTPAIEFTAVPPLGSDDNLQGRALHVPPADYRIAVYIRVGSGWWTKPTFAQPLTTIQSDGGWTCDITTGGQDRQASRIAAYLVPVGYAPPSAAGIANLPAELEQKAVAKTEVSR